MTISFGTLEQHVRQISPFSEALPYTSADSADQVTEDSDGR
ncbi:hypothetical protein [Acaryochloris marina]|uniref:Uncharacterized protein n=1 Tax=Acaryochloris marina (strain MBIC 11017) TaxID=329726 RepID=A8ZLL9_ACAM1|nr:hypothetical protein [Acaryochloris marina]ABW32046.1 hypothetical protein AM1_B0327 [Acaryochloris marina MBIC11017]